MTVTQAVQATTDSSAPPAASLPKLAAWIGGGLGTIAVLLGAYTTALAALTQAKEATEQALTANKKASTANDRAGRAEPLTEASYERLANAINQQARQLATAQQSIDLLVAYIRMQSRTGTVPVAVAENPGAPAAAVPTTPRAALSAMSAQPKPRPAAALPAFSAIRREAASAAKPPAAPAER